MKSILQTVALFGAIFTAVNFWQAYQSRAKPLSRNVLTRSWQTLAQGEQAILADHDVTLVYAFAPWCGVCKISAANLSGLAQSPVRVVSVALAYQAETEVRAFVTGHGLTGPVLLGAGELEDALDVGQFPTYFMFDRQGKMLFGWTGYTTVPGLWLRIKLAALMTSMAV